MHGTIQIIGPFSKNAPPEKQEALFGLVVQGVLCTTSENIPCQSGKNGTENRFGIGIPLSAMLKTITESQIPKEIKDFWGSFFSCNRGFNKEIDVLFLPHTSFFVIKKGVLTAPQAFEKYTGQK